MSDERTSPEEALASAMSDLPEGAFLTAAVVAVSYVVPGEDDADEQGPFLAWRCDGVAGRWVHLGMIEAIGGDMRDSLRMNPDD